MNDRLPLGWTTSKLKDIVTARKGKKPAVSMSSQRQGFVPYLDIQAIEKGTFTNYAEISTSRIGSDEDIFVVWDGARSGWAGLGKKGAIGSTIMAIRPNIDSRSYLHRWLQNQFEYINANTRGTGIPHVDPEIFWNLEVPIAPTNEQHRIVAKLEKLLANVEACQERLDKIPDILKRFRQSVLSAACSGNLTRDWREQCNQENRDRADESGSHLPTAWKLVHLGVLISDGPYNGLYKPQSAYGSGTPIVRIDAFYDGAIISWKELKRLRLSVKEARQFSLSNGDILINRVNSPKFLGKAALVRKMPEPSVYESNMMRLRMETSQVKPEYAILYLCSMRGREELRKNAKHAINQSSINQEDVKAVLFVLPPLSEQQEIVRRVEALFKIADQIEERYKRAKAQIDKLTQSILAKAFRGELVPQDPNDEHASVLLERIRSAKSSDTPTPNTVHTKSSKKEH